MGLPEGYKGLTNSSNSNHLGLYIIKFKKVKVIHCSMFFSYMLPGGFCF